MTDEPKKIYWTMPDLARELGCKAPYVRRIAGGIGLELAAVRGGYIANAAQREVILEAVRLYMTSRFTMMGVKVEMEQQVLKLKQ